MSEQFILGIVQGIGEWLPVSSEGLIVLLKTHLFPTNETIDYIIKNALFLHMGTFLAALVYFRNDVKDLTQALFRISPQDAATQKTLRFLVISTVISGTVGLILLKTLVHYTRYLSSSHLTITALIGLALLITGFLQLRVRVHGMRTQNDLVPQDAVLLGFAQGFAALPGLSRSGLTVASLLLLKFDKACALRLSFLMSLPIVLLGNIVLNLGQMALSLNALVGLGTAFVFGLVTIHGLLKIAEKINFGCFVILFGLLTIASAFV